MSNRSRVFGPCFFRVKKIEAIQAEFILVLAPKWRKSQKVLMLQGKVPSPNLEKVVFFPKFSFAKIEIQGCILYYLMVYLYIIIDILYAESLTELDFYDKNITYR